MTKDHKHMDSITFHDIPYHILLEMAKHLDNNGEANWEALADYYRLLPVDIEVISFFVPLLYRPYQITTPVSITTHFLQTRCPSCHPTNSIKTLKAILFPETGHISLWLLTKFSMRHPSTSRIVMAWSYISNKFN